MLALHYHYNCFVLSSLWLHCVDGQNFHSASRLQLSQTWVWLVLKAIREWQPTVKYAFRHYHIWCWCQFFSCATTCHNLYESFPHSPCCLWHTVFIVNLFNTSMTFKYGYAARYWRMNIIRYTDHKHTLQASSCHTRCRVCDYEFCMFIMLDDNMAKKKFKYFRFIQKMKRALFRMPYCIDA